jgi:type IV secretory pathway TrbL component
VVQRILVLSAAGAARNGIDMAKGDISTYNEDGVWKSKVEGSSRAAHTGGTKAEQQAVGREMASERRVEHTVRKLDGTIGSKNSYGNDPHPPAG